MMNKRFYSVIVVVLLQTVVLWARPGYKMPVDVLQPDGTTVTLLMQGDEFHSFMTTTDGYTVIKDKDGYYRYAVKEGDRLKASSFVARNVDLRSTEEQNFLAGCRKKVSAKMSEVGKRWKEQVSKMYRTTYENLLADGTRRAITPGAISERIDYSKFKGLVVLVNWNDRSFNINEPVNFYQKLTSEQNYTDNTKTVYPYNIKGSVRDYFRANSMGIFDPVFDVVGPVQIDYSCLYPAPKDAQGNVSPTWETRIVAILKAVMEQVNSLVDFNNYDLNSDGNIDMVYIIFAGYGSYVQGNNTGYMWPHANDFSMTWYENKTFADYYKFPKYDGKKFGRYACSVEIQDYEGYAALHAYPDGIGTMCHEFSHVLGLADHYNTNDSQSTLVQTPGNYDLMDNGADFNQGLSPVGYSAFERYILGFADNDVKTLDVAGEYTLEPFNTGNKAYIVKSAKNGEVFYVENRQQKDWDESIPKNGLFVWRIDTSNPQKFINNEVNISAGSECVTILGNGPVTTLDLTATNNATWGAKGAVIDLYDITSTDGVITFEAGKDLYPPTVEDFEATPVAQSGATALAGKFCSWSLQNAEIAETATAGYGTGQHVAVLHKGGMLTSSVLEKEIRELKFTVKNSSESAIRFYLRTSTDGGTTWTAFPTSASFTTINKNVSRSVQYFGIPAGCQFQLAVTTTTSSATSATCYIDNIEVTFKKDASGIESVTTAPAVKGNGALYNLAGQRVDSSYKGIVIRNGKKAVSRAW